MLADPLRALLFESKCFWNRPSSAHRLRRIGTEARATQPRKNMVSCVSLTARGRSKKPRLFNGESRQQRGAIKVKITKVQKGSGGPQNKGLAPLLRPDFPSPATP